MHAGGQSLEARQRRIEAPVDDDQPEGSVGVGDSSEVLGGAGHRIGRSEIDRRRSAPRW